MASRSGPSRAFGGRTQKPCHFPDPTVGPPLTNGVSTVDFGIRDKFETCSAALRSRSRPVDAGTATTLLEVPEAVLQGPVRRPGSRAPAIDAWS